MASYSFLAPRPTNAILSDVDHIREIQWVLAQWNPSLADDAPEDSKRLVPLDSAKTQYRFERLVGSNWNSVGKLMHDVDTLDGHHASVSAVKNTIPVYNADAKLVGDLTGNANTATTLKNIRKFQIGGIASGGFVNFDGSADATIEITQLTVNNANDTAINGILTVKHGGTGGADAATARANLGVPAIDHSSTAKTFGVASTTKYGHSIGSDTLNSTFTADKGYFFSPKGANDLDSTLRAFIAQEGAKKLSLSGGTMTGTLVGTSYDQMCNSIDQSETPSENKYGSSIRFLDKNKVPVGRMTVFRIAGGTTVLRLSSLLPDGENGTHFDILTGEGVQKMQLLGTDVLTSAGGTLTGQLMFDQDGLTCITRKSNDKALIISGGNAWNQGAVLTLNGGSYSSNPSMFEIRSYDGDNYSRLAMTPQSFTWNSHNIITANGGTLTGRLKSSAGATNGSFSAASNDGQVRICGGDGNWSQGGIGLWYGIASTSFPGGWAMISMNPDGQGSNVALRGYYDSASKKHVLTYNSNDIITAAGGVMRGALALRNSYSNLLNSSVTFGVGTAWNDAPSLSLYGPDASSSANSFVLRAGANAAALTGRADGGLYWRGNSLLVLVNSWTSGNNWYRQYADGRIEQGGSVSIPYNENTTVTLHLPFSNANYTVVATPMARDSTTECGSRLFIHNTRTSTTFTIGNRVVNNAYTAMNAVWYACGY